MINLHRGTRHNAVYIHAGSQGGLLVHTAISRMHFKVRVKVTQVGRKASNIVLMPSRIVQAKKGKLLNQQHPDFNIKPLEQAVRICNAIDLRLFVP